MNSIVEPTIFLAKNKIFSSQCNPNARLVWKFTIKKKRRGPLLSLIYLDGKKMCVIQILINYESTQIKQIRKVKDLLENKTTRKKKKSYMWLIILSKKTGIPMKNISMCSHYFVLLFTCSHYLIKNIILLYCLYYFIMLKVKIKPLILDIL